MDSETDYCGLWFGSRHIDDGGGITKKCVKQARVAAEVKICDFKSLGSLASTADLLVSIAPYEKANYGIPMVTGIPLLTGIGAETTVDEIVKILKK